jgi:Domain of Unknown Function (DUF1080)
MKSLLRLALLLCSLSPAWAAEEGFVSMFNGRDLSGWTNINCAPETWTVKDGNIHCTGRPVGALRTLRQYENFIIEAEWRHLSSGGNSGMFMWGTAISAPGVPFLRGIEVQVLDHGYAEQWEKENGKKSDWFTTHGDVFPIHGATMKPHGPHRGDRSFPTEERSKRSPEWNHYRVVASNGVLRLSVNGKEVSGGSECNYRKGYLALESEGAPVEFRNLRIKELPSSNPDPKTVAPLDPGWMPLYNGVDLRGWRDAAAAKTRWQANGWQLALKGSGDARHTLWTEGKFGEVEFTLDVRPGKDAKGDRAPALLVRGRDGNGSELKLAGVEPGRWTRVRVQVRGGEAVVFAGEKEVGRAMVGADAGELGLKDVGAAVEFGNLHVRGL